MTSYATRFLLVFIVALVGCGDSDDLDSEREARWAYLGFDRAVDRAIGLGMDGFNAATNANIPPQNASGDVAGTILITGQVDQGVSANKEMNLNAELTDYSDNPVDDPTTEDTTEELSLTYNTDAAALPLISLSLRNIPNGTFTGSLTGRFIVSGDVNAEAEFSLQLSGSIQEDSANSGDIIRTPGTLSITGTVVSGDGTYDVDFTQ